MSRAEDLVRSLKKSNDKQRYNESDWTKCQYAGCILPATIKAEQVTCTYHFKEQYGRFSDAISSAIKENYSFLKKYNEMIMWNVRTWKDREPQILGWDLLPMKKEEAPTPTVYLIRFKKWIDNKIKERASEIIEGKL